jgi:hypothetical protein
VAAAVAIPSGPASFSTVAASFPNAADRRSDHRRTAIIGGTGG